MSESLASPYPAPKTQELSLLARKIQGNDNDYLRREIANNPRLLALGTDVPTILQEGFRYNALHVAARYGNAEAAQIVLSTVNAPAYMKAMYPDDPQFIRDQRTRYLTDMYLNSPDKGFLETPLHFASKFGCYDVVKILIGHPLCDLTLTNKEKKTAQEIVCSRATGKNVDEKEKIEKLFKQTKIVPIWRDLTNDTPPIVGPPVNPKYLAQYTPKTFRAVYGDIAVEHFGPADMSCIPKGVFGSNRDIRAYAGPMDDSTATLLYNAMKGSSGHYCNNNTVVGTPSNMPKPGVQCDLEQPGTPPSNAFRKLSETGIDPIFGAPVTPEQKAKILSGFRTPTQLPSTPKCPVTSNLLSPSKFQYTPQTLSLLLSSPSPAVVSTPHVVEDRRLRLRDPEKGVERLGRKYASEMEVAWTEYWVFLGEFVDLASEAGLVSLEDHLARMRMDIESQKMNLNLSPNSGATPITSICRAMQRLELGPDSAQAKPKQQVPHDWRNRLNRLGNDDLETETGGGDTGDHFVASGSMVVPSTSAAVVKQNPLPRCKVFIRELPLDDDDEEEEFHMTQPYVHKESVSEDELGTGHEWRTPHDSFASCESSTSSSPFDSDVDLESDDYEDCFMDCRTDSVFLHGILPSKEDTHAMRAVEPVMDRISFTKYPEIVGWYNCLKASGIN